MTQWQPMHTAPRDGTELLLQYDKSAISDGAVRIIGWYFTSPKQIDDGWTTDIGSIGEPVAWMPAPARSAPLSYASLSGSSQRSRAARNAALEEAAKVADAEAQAQMRDGEHWVVTGVAAAIRELKGK